jgi:hypothetical protein
MRTLLRAIAFLGLISFGVASEAHKQSDSYLSIDQPSQGATLSVQWDIALRDLEHAIGLDTNADAVITWGELRQRQATVVSYAQSHLQIANAIDRQQRSCPLQFAQLLVDEHVDGKYAVLRFDAVCDQRAARIEVNYSLLFDVDPNHRGLVNITSNGQSQAAVFAQTSGVQQLSLAATQRSTQFTSFVTEGIWHIWQGYDHVLFLMTLLLPAVVLYRDRRWEPRESLSDSMLDIVKVVSAFTLAHSLTLTLGALGWVYVPTRLVESAIALTVLFGALNILFAVVRERRWLLAFIFGLIHGLAFASVLVDLGLHGWNLLLALLGFNAGVEIGQLVIVIVAIPLMYASRRTVIYRRVFMPCGAVAVAIVSVYWFATRAFI